jgi:hypothetical protein
MQPVLCRPARPTRCQRLSIHPNGRGLTSDHSIQDATEHCLPPNQPVIRSRRRSTSCVCEMPGSDGRDSTSPHFYPPCATAWNKQCRGSGLRLALLVQSSRTRWGNFPCGEKCAQSRSVPRHGNRKIDIYRGSLYIDGVLNVPPRRPPGQFTVTFALPTMLSGIPFAGLSQKRKFVL